MDREPRIIDYDRIEAWSPWLDEVMASIAPHDLIDALRSTRRRCPEIARDDLVAEVGYRQLVNHLNCALESYEVQVFHGTRVTSEELRSIETNGLRALKLSDRRDSLAAIFTKHPEWAGKESQFDELLYQFGEGWNAGVGKREDGFVYTCLSRAGLLYACNYYLTHGSEADKCIAQALFPDGSGLDLLAGARDPKIVSFTAPFRDAAKAANPCEFLPPPPELPALIKLLISPWAFRLADSTFTTELQREGAELRFFGPVGPEHLEIEHVDDAELQKR